MKIPVVIGESVKLPLNPRQPTQWRLLRRKATDTQLALFLLLRQVNNNSFTYTMRHRTHTQKTKDTVTGLTRCTHWSFTVAVWLFVIEKFLYLWWSTRANNAKMIATLMCVRALCLVVMVSVDLNCLLWVNHTAFIFSFFRASVFEDSIGWPLPGPLQKISHTRHLSVSFVNLTRPWLPLSSAWKKIRNLISPKIGLGHRSHSYGWLQTDLLFSQFPIKV